MLIRQRIFLHAISDLYALYKNETSPFERTRNANGGSDLSGIAGKISRRDRNICECLDLSTTTNKKIDSRKTN